MFQRRFNDISVAVVMLDSLSAPRQRRGSLPAQRNLIRPQRARRPALLVHARLELLGLDEIPPPSLQRQRPRRVPRQAYRRRIERPGFDVPTMLFRLAAVAPADLRF